MAAQLFKNPRHSFLSCLRLFDVLLPLLPLTFVVHVLYLQNCISNLVNRIFSFPEFPLRLLFHFFLVQSFCPEERLRSSKLGFAKF